MIQDRQVFRLRKFLAGGMSLCLAAAKSGMEEKTARKYRDGQLPSETAPDHDWRTREDPFEGVWEEVHEQLDLEPALKAKTLFQWLQRRYPGRFQDGQLRTLQRGVKRWRATQGPPKEVFFSQVHHPGDLCASDFTNMNGLRVTIQGQPFEHLLYHFVLTYSNWESVTLCFSESFESLSDGLQNALWDLGGVPKRHRTDRLSAAVNNLTEQRDFTARYRGLMDHYDLEMERIQAGQANENGDAESLHGHLKTAVDQALMLRGSRDFDSQDAYCRFLRELVSQKNGGRQQRLDDELGLLAPLPARRRESFKRIKARVNSGSLIRVQDNTYSVDSRLVGESVDVRVHAGHLEVWYAQRVVDKLPRLRGRNKHCINYRHVIDTLVRKPGAFENYRYREDLFPTIRFRIAYDMLRERRSGSASREYLRLLELAAKENEGQVDEALRTLLDQERTPTRDDVRQLLDSGRHLPAATEVEVKPTDLASFDSLLTNKEEWNDCQLGCENDVDWIPEGLASADLS